MRWTTTAMAVALTIGATSVAEAQQGTTKGGYVACTTREALSRSTKILVSGDKDGWAAFIADRSNGCFFLKAGIPVYIESYKFTVMEIRPKGMTETVWVPSEAVSTR